MLIGLSIIVCLHLWHRACEIVSPAFEIVEIVDFPFCFFKSDDKSWILTYLLENLPIIALKTGLAKTAWLQELLEF